MWTGCEAICQEEGKNQVELQRKHLKAHILREWTCKHLNLFSIICFDCLLRDGKFSDIEGHEALTNRISSEDAALLMSLLQGLQEKWSGKSVSKSRSPCCVTGACMRRVSCSGIIYDESFCVDVELFKEFGTISRMFVTSLTLLLLSLFIYFF